MAHRPHFATIGTLYGLAVDTADDLEFNQESIIHVLVISLEKLRTLFG